jgi:hypothetical protein
VERVYDRDKICLCKGICERCETSCHGGSRIQ